MWKRVNARHQVARALVLGGAMLLKTSLARGQERTPAFPVDGHVVLHALVSLSDAHLQKLADILTILATTDDARSASWERIRAPLARAAGVNVPAILWFARPDGAYWTVTHGRADSSLSSRPYFPRLLAGRTVLGDLVVSRSSHRNTAIVAVPVRSHSGSIVGVLGSSIHLDSLTAIVIKEIGGLDPAHVFFAIGSGGLGALNTDPKLIFTEPMKLGDEGMRRAFSEMLSGSEGTVSYTFRGSRRTVLYRKSDVTGWWYGFGVIEPSR